MKIFFNSLFLLGIISYIGAGTVPVWKCLKENKLKITVECFEKEKKSTCCSKESSPSITTLSDICCKLIDQSWISSLNKSFEESNEVNKIHYLAYKLFEIPAQSKKAGIVSVSNESPTRGSPPLYIIHSSYLC